MEDALHRCRCDFFYGFKKEIAYHYVSLVNDSHAQQQQHNVKMHLHFFKFKYFFMQLKGKTTDSISPGRSVFHFLHNIMTSVE